LTTAVATRRRPRRDDRLYRTRPPGSGAGTPADDHARMPIPEAGVRMFGDTARFRPGEPERVLAALFLLSGCPVHSRSGHSRSGHSRSGHSRSGHSGSGHSGSGPSRVVRVAIERLATLLDQAMLAHPRGEVDPAQRTLSSSAALDVAAALVELADRLHRAGHVIEAFALEGIEGRLIEALVGAGPRDVA